MSKVKQPTQGLLQQVARVPRYKTTGNAKAFPIRFEKNSGERETVPNQTMSVKDILKRFTGMSYPQTRQLQYNGEKFVYDIAEFKRLDISEQQDIIEEARARTMDTIKKLRRKGELDKEKDLEAFYRSKFEQEIKSATVGKQTKDEPGTKAQD